MSQTTETLTLPTAGPTPEKRCAIVGTAQTFKLAPWKDLACDILTLNDGYALGWRMGLPELPRHTIHFDLHPFNQMYFTPKGQKVVNTAAVPIGAYLRPEGHLQWLASRPHPVYLHQAPPDWPHARTFPRAEIEAFFGTNYFTSTPAWMLAWALKEGYTTIEVYGIHLATEWEYVSQRPNFEWWLRCAMDRGVKLVLPVKCPLLKSKHVYAYEPKPDLPLKAIEHQIAVIKQEGATLQKRLMALRYAWFSRGEIADLMARLEVVNLELADARQAQHRIATVVHAA